MFRCAICSGVSHVRTSRYLTELTKEVYYQCRDINCSATFKTLESVDKIISMPDEKTKEKLK